jgi:signal transduction histidine kinase
MANAETALELLKQDGGPALRALAGLRRGIERADRLIGSLLDLVDVQGGLFSIARAPVRLDEMLRHVIERLSPPAAARVQLVETTPITVSGDEPRLRRAVQAVLDNALKYSANTTTVEVALEVDGDYAVLSIRDRGFGIPLDKQPHIFEKYFRAHADTSCDSGGLGVGLFVARVIVEENGGRIWFESTASEGTVFFIQLPRDRKQI